MTANGKNKIKLKTMNIETAELNLMVKGEYFRLMIDPSYALMLRKDDVLSIDGLEFDDAGEPIDNMPRWFRNVHPEEVRHIPEVEKNMREEDKTYYVITARHFNDGQVRIFAEPEPGT